MLKNLLSNRIFIGILVLIICGVVSVYFLRTDLPEEPIKIYTPVEPMPKPKAEIPIGETERGGHVHEDGTWHEGTHEAHAPPTAPNMTPPGAATTPDFPSVDPNEDPVEAAYKRLEYIKNNPYAWGGVHSERATELIAQLMPPPILMDEDHGEVVIEQILELIAQNDPRAAEVLITHMCEGHTVGEPMFEGLDTIGPPALPYILPYLEKGVTEGGDIRLAVFESLGRLGARYRGDLGGIVDHIIIPKLEVIAADEDNEFYRYADVKRASEALSVLR
ncbi:MAG: hypothetical protein OXH00_25715 [Candidatus Poribacteria bacterium]|nr:hypothetical protein [Candidatus Poribacteria bacterium]